MIRTVLTIGLFALLGLFVLKLAFGVFGMLFGLLSVLLVLALKIALVGLAIYLVVRVVSPDTARSWREKWANR